MLMFAYVFFCISLVLIAMAAKLAFQISASVRKSGERNPRTKLQMQMAAKALGMLWGAVGNITVFALLAGAAKDTAVLIALIACQATFAVVTVYMVRHARSLPADPVATPEPATRTAAEEE